MLGDKVKILRKEMKITQQRLATTIGVSQSTIGMIEGNKQGASNETLIKLANALNTTVDYLLSDDIKEIGITDKNNEAKINYIDAEIKYTDAEKNIDHNYIDDDDIRRIERARRKMDPKNKEKMMKILRSAFDEYFDD